VIAYEFIDESIPVRVIAALATDEGDRILLNERGARHVSPAIAEQMARGEDPDPSLYYFREALTFETSDPQLAWFRRVLAIGTGRRTPDRVLLDVFEVL
jgi:hypothetical protein